MNENLKPGERGYQLTCGCCAGPENDRCCCHIHQDIPRGIWVKKCSLHRPAIFRDHRCWKCRDGALPCVEGGVNRCGYPHARND